MAADERELHPLPVSGLISVELECRACARKQVWALPVEALVAGAHTGLTCWACQRVGVLMLPDKENADD